jgi:hypothetical protein
LNSAGSQESIFREQGSQNSGFWILAPSWPGFSLGCLRLGYGNHNRQEISLNMKFMNDEEFKDLKRRFIIQRVRGQELSRAMKN